VTWLNFGFRWLGNFALVIRRLFAFTLLLALASGPLLRLAVLGDYVLRFERYAAACENLARPEMQCNGSCQLSKELRSIEERGAPEPLSAEWLKLKISEFTVAEAVANVVFTFEVATARDFVVPQTSGQPSGAFGTLTPPPKIG
jgi:hypothetical protein